MATRTEVSSPRGVKRCGDDSLDSEQRLAKRFNLLNIENEGKFYIPVSAEHSTTTSNPSQSNSDLMQVEDTKDRVFIHDLDAELAESEPDEEQLIFIPDIERHLAKVPKHVLTDRDQDTKKENQLILYQIPATLSVPENKDSVRKVIIEARTRAQQKQGQLRTDPPARRATDPTKLFQLEAVTSQTMHQSTAEEDVDAMDIE